MGNTYALSKITASLYGADPEVKPADAFWNIFSWTIDIQVPHFGQDFAITILIAPALV